MAATGHPSAAALTPATGWAGKRLLLGIGLQLITVAGHKRPEHAQSVIVAFEQLGQALAEHARVLVCRPVPFRVSFSPGFVELEVYGEINGRLDGADHHLMTRTTIPRIRFDMGVQSVLQRRCQELCKITCVLRFVHEPPPGYSDSLP